MFISLLYKGLSMMIGMLVAFSAVGARGEISGNKAWDQKTYVSEFSKRESLIKPARLEVTYDNVLRQAFAQLKKETGLDIEGVVANTPDIYANHRWLTKVLPFVFYGLRDSLMSGTGITMTFRKLIGASMGMPTRAHFAAVQKAGKPGQYDIFLRFYYADGSTREINTYSIYNAATGYFGSNTGVAGFGYNFTFKGETGPYAYTTNDPFQRALGYTKLYDDLLLQTSRMVNVDTVRLKFVYQGKDWMLQLWKGRYFVTTGGEIGLYSKPRVRLNGFYDAVGDADRIKMSFKLSTRDNRIVFFDRPLTLHWWMTGFAVREYIYPANKLLLETKVVPRDAEMLRALKGALDKEVARKVLTYSEPEAGMLLIHW